MSRSDAELLSDALEHLATLHRHLERADLDDATVADAVSLRLASAIEALAATSDEVRARVSGGRWHVIWATRNRIAHGYAGIDHAIIRATVERDLPALEAALRREVQQALPDRPRS
ncbi:HepT-like ribonuclease domain-containing protein [Agromyces silvae]|uniref:HepT-like ribonuclease domain-containing protein n=1 Tax=Agromyces silvae TaxID=3388266 RepID=UPI00280C2EF4|nr:HepT-like ribonuclease domain-containing protein [Agromyces protaetiae]